MLASGIGTFCVHSYKIKSNYWRFKKKSFFLKHPVEEQLREALISQKPLFLLGDININVIDTASADTRHYLSALSDLNLTQLVQEPTHLHPTPTCLDHAITNIAQCSVSIIGSSMSDHQPVIVEAPIGRLRRRPNYKTTRSWRTAYWDAICLDFLLADWDSLHNCSDVNQMVKKFMEVWTETLDRHCPLRRRRVRHPDCPWLTDNRQLREAMTERDEARSAWKAANTTEAADRYRRLRNEVKKKNVINGTARFPRAAAPQNRQKRFLAAAEKPLHGTCHSQRVTTASRQRPTAWAGRQLQRLLLDSWLKYGSRTPGRREGRRASPEAANCRRWDFQASSHHPAGAEPHHLRYELFGNSRIWWRVP